MNERKNIAKKIKNHFLRTGTFLLYTLVFNVVSFILYFIPAFSTHTFEGVVWLPYGILQIVFTVFFFRNVPLPKLSYDKGTKLDLLLYFIIISIISVAIIFYKYKVGNDWFTFTYFNTFYHLIGSTSWFDNMGMYIFMWIAENIIKTCCLYKNTLGESKASAKTISRVSVTLIVLYFAFVLFLFISRFLQILL